MSDACARKDLAKPDSRWLLWGLPAIMFVVGGLIPTLRPRLTSKR